MSLMAKTIFPDCAARQSIANAGSLMECPIFYMMPGGALLINHVLDMRGILDGLAAVVTASMRGDDGAGCVLHAISVHGFTACRSSS